MVSEKRARTIKITAYRNDLRRTIASANFNYVEKGLKVPQEILDEIATLKRRIAEEQQGLT